jgi:hypothetical protein
MPDDLDIRLKVSGDTTGAKAVEKTLKDVEKQAKATGAGLNKLEQGQAKIGKGGRNSAAAILEASRALEDLQYGVRGVLNNIPTLVMALGGSAGLAGVISIAAVSISQAASMMAKLSDETSTANDELEENADLAKEAETSNRALGRALEEQAAKLRTNNQEIDRRLQILKELQKVEDSFEDLKLAQEIADIEASDLSPADKAVETDKARNRRAQARRIAEEEEAQLELEAQRQGVTAQRQGVAALAATANTAQAEVFGIRERRAIEQRLPGLIQERKRLQAIEDNAGSTPQRRQQIADLDAQIQQQQDRARTLPTGDPAAAQQRLTDALDKLRAAVQKLEQSEADLTAAEELEAARAITRGNRAQIDDLEGSTRLRDTLDTINAREISKLAPGVRSVTTGTAGSATDAVTSATEALKDGGTIGELQALTDALKTFGETAIQNDAQRAEQITQLRAEIARLQSQLANQRT